MVSTESTVYNNRQAVVSQLITTLVLSFGVILWGLCFALLCYNGPGYMALMQCVNMVLNDRGWGVGGVMGGVYTLSLIHISEPTRPP